MSTSPLIEDVAALKANKAKNVDSSDEVENDCANRRAKKSPNGASNGVRLSHVNGCDGDGPTAPPSSSSSSALSVQARLRVSSSPAGSQDSVSGQSQTIESLSEEHIRS